MAESEDTLRAMVQDVVRVYRLGLKTISSERPFLREMAWFLVQATYLQQSQKAGSTASSEEIVKKCVKLLKLEDFPVMETIQLQVNIYALMFMHQRRLAKEEDTHRRCCDDYVNQALETQVYDRRKISTTVDNLHKIVVAFVKEINKRVDEDMSVSHSEDEIRTAIDSIFPRTGLLCWMELSDVDKVSQMQELSNIVPGIRAYNRLKGKSSTLCQDIFRVFDNEVQKLKNMMEDEIKSVTDRAVSYTKFITSHLDTLGTHHVLIQRLRDELHYDLQLSSFFEDIHSVVMEMHHEMEKLSGKFHEQLEVLEATIGSQTCVPNELVFPEFQKIGLLQRNASKELRRLRVQMEVVQELCTLSNKPAFKRTPVGLAGITTDCGFSKLEIIVDNCGFLPPEVYTTNVAQAQPNCNEASTNCTSNVRVLKDLRVEGSQLQLNGYCPITILYKGTLLLHGDPKAGIAQVGEKIFVFSNADCLNEFVKAPEQLWTDLEMVVILRPQLIHILGLQSEPKFMPLSIPHVLELVNKHPPRQEFSTQTALHIQPEHVFDEETFFKRALQLSSKRTHSTQTTSSHFHRDSFSQVWLPRDKSTQSLFAKGTTMPKKLKLFENLRGPPHLKFKALDIVLDV